MYYGVQSTKSRINYGNQPTALRCISDLEFGSQYTQLLLSRAVVFCHSKACINYDRVSVEALEEGRIRFNALDLGILDTLGNVASDLVHAASETNR